MLLFRPHRLRWIAPLAWMALIFIGSTDVLAAGHTSRIVEPFLRWLFHGNLSPQSVEEVHFFIRKAGHFCEYAVLSVLLWWAPPSPSNSSSPRWRKAALASGLAALFAASDEFHQSFVPTRGASVRDVVIDATGAIAGISFLLATSALARSMHHRSTPTP